MDTTDTTDSWEQRDGEPDRDHARFLQWLALPDRRLVASCEPLGLKMSRLKELSHTWNWQARAADYDRHQTRECLAGSQRQRFAAGIALATVVREASEDMLNGVERHDPLAVQRLASALRTITPGTTLDDLTSTPAETDAGDIIRQAVQLSQDLERDREDREEELYDRPERPAITLAPEPVAVEAFEAEPEPDPEPQQRAALGISVRALLREVR